jgi:hypothetical protein
LIPESGQLLNLVMEEFHGRSPSVRPLEAMVKIVKLVGIERNLSEEQLSELLLCAVREALQVELTSARLGGSKFKSDGFGAAGDSRADLISGRIDSLRGFSAHTSALLALRADVRAES